MAARLAAHVQAIGQGFPGQLGIWSDAHIEGLTRLAGKIHDPADVQRVLDAGVDIAVLGRVAILHHDYPQLLKADAGFVPRRPPIRPDVLMAEGVSPKFVTYLSGSFKGFVDQSAQ